MSTPRIGVNVYKADATACNDIYADGLKSSVTGFVLADFQTPAPVGPDRWPSGDFGIAIIQSTYPYSAGRWTIYTAGQFVLSAGKYGLDGTINPPTYNATTNTTTQTVDIAGGNNRVNLYFSGTKRLSTDTTATGLTNVKVMRPIAPGSMTSHDPSEVFSRACLAELAPFALIRTLDLNGANNSPYIVNGVKTTTNSVNWSDRKSPLDPCRLGPWDEIPWEDMNLLANTLNVDVWHNIPDQATDAYATALVQCCLYGTDANGTPYTTPQAQPVHPPVKNRVIFERSNEDWNFSAGFPQASRINDEAIALNTKFGKTDDKVIWKTRWYCNFAELIIAAAGTSVIGSKVLPAIMFQYASANQGHEALDYIATYYPRPVTQVVSAVGADWYYALLDGTVAGGMQVAGSAATVNTSPSLFATMIAADPRFAGVLNFAYEGCLTGFQGAASTDPAINPLVVSTITNLVAGKADVACVYCSSCYTNYAYAPSPYQLAASPRYQGILAGMAAIGQTPPVTVTPTPQPTGTLPTGRLLRLIRHHQTQS